VLNLPIMKNMTNDNFEMISIRNILIGFYIICLPIKAQINFNDVLNSPKFGIKLGGIYSSIENLHSGSTPIYDNGILDFSNLTGNIGTTIGLVTFYNINNKNYGSIEIEIAERGVSGNIINLEKMDFKLTERRYSINTSINRSINKYLYLGLGVQYRIEKLFKGNFDTNLDELSYTVDISPYHSKIPLYLNFNLNTILSKKFIFKFEYSYNINKLEYRYVQFDNVRNYYLSGSYFTESLYGRPSNDFSFSIIYLMNFKMNE